MNNIAAQLTIFGGVIIKTALGPKPIYWGPRDWARVTQTAKGIGAKIGIGGLAITTLSVRSEYLRTGRVSTSSQLDLTFGALSLTGPGAIPSAVYFGTNLLTIGISGRSIGENIDRHFFIIHGGLYPILIPKRLKQ